MITALLRLLAWADRRADAVVRRHVTAALGSISPDDVEAESALLRCTTLPARVVTGGTP